MELVPALSPRGSLPLLVLSMALFLPGARGDAHRELLALLERADADRKDASAYHRLAGAERASRLAALGREAARDLVRVPFERLDTEGRVDYLLFEALLARRAEEDEREAAHVRRLAGIAPFFPFLLGIEQLDRQVAGGWPHARLAAVLQRVREEADAAAGRLAEAAGKLATPEAGSLADPVFVRWAADAGEGAAGYLKEWYDHHAETEPGFRWWLEKPLHEAHAALLRWRDTLRNQIGERLKALKGRNVHAIGELALARALELHFVPHTPASLLALGERKMAEIESDLAAMARKIDPAAPRWQAVLERLKTEQVPPERQREYVAGVAEEAIGFVTAKRLWRVPELARELWFLSPISGADQKRFPFAYYSGLRMGVAYSRSGMSHGEKLASMRGNNRYFTRTVVPHELIPGHHLQLHYAARHRTWRGRFRSSFLVEGHGLYTELVLDEHGFFRDPKERMGHLFWKLLRAARIVVSTRYHLGTMTQPAMVDFMMHRVGLEREGAQAEVDRYMVYSPLYQASYMVGALEILALREECRAKRGSAFSLERFHEELLEQNSIPVALSRYALLGLEVPRRPPAVGESAGR